MTTTITITLENTRGGNLVVALPPQDARQARIPKSIVLKGRGQAGNQSGRTVVTPAQFAALNASKQFRQWFAMGWVKIVSPDVVNEEQRLAAQLGRQQTAAELQQTELAQLAAAAAARIEREAEENMAAMRAAAAAAVARMAENASSKKKGRR